MHAEVHSNSPRCKHLSTPREKFPNIKNKAKGLYLSYLPFKLREQIRTNNNMNEFFGKAMLFLSSYPVFRMKLLRLPRKESASQSGL
jgi:hypothetical protein